MRLVIAETGPINYLIAIGHIGLLSSMFETVMVPLAVAAELKMVMLPMQCGGGSTSRRHGWK